MTKNPIQAALDAIRALHHSDLVDSAVLHLVGMPSDQLETALEMFERRMIEVVAADAPKSSFEYCQGIADAAIQCVRARLAEIESAGGGGRA